VNYDVPDVEPTSQLTWTYEEQNKEQRMEKSIKDFSNTTPPHRKHEK
jgi:hypothetical protein